MGEYVYEEGIPNLEDESEESSDEDDDDDPWDSDSTIFFGEALRNITIVPTYLVVATDDKVCSLEQAEWLEYEIPAAR